jgi:hypothetical protein
MFAAAAGTILGCSYPTDLPITYWTTHLRIGVEPHEPLCLGDLLALERQIAWIEDELELELEKTHTIYLWSDESWEQGAINNCTSEHALGCIAHTRRKIWTSRGALEHEVAHAVVGWSKLHDFFDEGLADVYAGRQTQFGFTAPSNNINGKRWTTDVRTAAHFLRWLREREGPRKLGRLVESRTDGFEGFQAVYGMTIEEAEQLYFEEAPYAYPAFDECSGPDLLASEFIDGWIDQVSLDCATGEDTRSSGIGIIVHRTLTIPEAGYYSVSTDGEWFDIFRCSGRVGADVPAPDPDWFTEDVPPSHAGYPSPAFRQYLGGEVHHLYFEVGRHDIGVGILGHDSGVVNVAIWPALAATPGVVE